MTSQSQIRCSVQYYSVNRGILVGLLLFFSWKLKNTELTCWIWDSVAHLFTVDNSSQIFLISFIKDLCLTIVLPMVDGNALYQVYWYTHETVSEIKCPILQLCSDSDNSYCHARSSLVSIHTNSPNNRRQLTMGDFYDATVWWHYLPLNLCTFGITV